MIIYGYQAISEAIDEGVPIHCIYVDRDRVTRRDRRFTKLRDKAGKLNIKIQEVPYEKLLTLDKEGAKTGFIALISEVPLIPFEEFEFKVEKNSLLVALDEVTDAGNFASIVRACAFFGVDAIIVTERRSPYISPQVVKVSSGGVFKVPIIRAKNLSRAISDLKEIGFWIVSLTPHVESTIYEVPVDIPLVVIAGNEERGIRRLIIENSDYRVKIPGSGRLESLNVSQAVAITISDICRRRLGF